MAKSLCRCSSSLDLVHSPWQMLPDTISRKVILLIDRSLFTVDLCWTVSEVLCLVGSPLSTWLWQKHAISKRRSSPVLIYINFKMHGFLIAQLELFAGLYFVCIVNIWCEIKGSQTSLALWNTVIILLWIDVDYWHNQNAVKLDS